MSIGGESVVGSRLLEVRRVRWRYVKGGLRMVMVFFVAVGSGLVSGSEACGMAGAWTVMIQIFANIWESHYLSSLPEFIA